MTNTTSVSLLQRLAGAGADDDWRRLFAVYQPFVRYRTASYPDLVDQADDIVQEVMLVLMRELPTFERQRKGSFRNWLKTITINQLRAAVRKKRALPRATFKDGDIERRIEQLADPKSDLSRRWDEEHDRAVMKLAMEIVRNEVKPHTWEAFRRYGQNAEPLASVADALGMTPNGVMLAKSRVLRRLREVVAGMID